MGNLGRIEDRNQRGIGQHIQIEIVGIQCDKLFERLSEPVGSGCAACVDSVIKNLGELFGNQRVEFCPGYLWCGKGKLYKYIQAIPGNQLSQIGIDALRAAFSLPCRNFSAVDTLGYLLVIRKNRLIVKLLEKASFFPAIAFITTRNLVERRKVYGQRIVLCFTESLGKEVPVFLCFHNLDIDDVNQLVQADMVITTVADNLKITFILLGQGLDDIANHFVGDGKLTGLGVLLAGISCRRSILFIDSLGSE